MNFSAEFNIFVLIVVIIKIYHHIYYKVIKYSVGNFDEVCQEVLLPKLI